MNRHHRFFQQAYREARKSPGRWKMGAVVVKNDVIIGRGYNFVLDFPLRYHAEVAAVLNSKTSVEGAVVYVYGFRKPKISKPKILLSKPCEGCRRFLAKRGIKSVYFLEEHGQDVGLLLFD